LQDSRYRSKLYLDTYLLQANLYRADTVTPINFLGDNVTKDVIVNNGVCTLSHCTFKAKSFTATTGRIVFQDNANYRTRNFNVCSGDGTAMTIPHGLDAIPTLIQLTLINTTTTAGYPYVYGTSDATNIYIATLTGKTFFWVAEYPYIGT